MNDLSLRPRPGESAQDVVARVEDAAKAVALAERLALAVENSDEHALFEAEGAICDRLGISEEETEMDLTRDHVERIEAWVSEKLGRPWGYGPRYGEPDAYAIKREER